MHAIDELPELLPHADVVIVIAPATPETEGLIGAEQLALLPDGALLVNVARGKLVDTDALVAETGSAGCGPRSTSPSPSRCRPTTRSGASERADLAARRRGQHRVLPARGPADRRPAAPIRRRAKNWRT